MIWTRMFPISNYQNYYEDSPWVELGEEFTLCMKVLLYFDNVPHKIYFIINILCFASFPTYSDCTNIEGF